MNIEQKTITSVEVAEMVSKDHNKLLRDIREYIEQLAQSNIGHGNFFTESTYPDANNQVRPCFLVSKKGCEFIAHKLRGIKGSKFTAQYIDKFHDMEDTLSTGLIQNLSPELQAIFIHDKKIQAVVEHMTKTDDRMDKLEFDIPLYGCEAKELSDHVKRKGVIVMGGKSSNAYKDTGIRQEVYRDIYDQIKREFGVRDSAGKNMTYLALKRKYLAEVHEFIDAYQLGFALREKIQDTNNQVNISDIA